MLVKINDISAMIENYIKASIKSDYPNSDLTGISSVVDLFVKPMTSISEILMEFSKDIELRSLLSNAADMKTEDLNDIGEGNYMTERSEGSKAFGTAQLRFKTVPDDRNLVIPIGTVFSTASGLKFQVYQTYSFSPEEISLKWSSSELAYIVDVSVEANEVGSRYNIGIGELTKIESSFTNHVVSVSNSSAFTEGLDEETNEEYVERIKSFVSSRTLETAPGYESEIRDSFEEVVDVYIAGYGDPLMERDLAESITIDGVTFTDRHVGGKVDIYIRGYNVNSRTISFNSLSNKLPLPEAISAIDQSSISMINATTTFSMSDFSVSEDAENDKVIITVNESAEWDYGDVVSVSYDSDTDEDGIYETPKLETFTIDNQVYPLESPLESISAIINRSRDNFYYDIGDGVSGTTDYSLTFEDENLRETSGEEAYIEVTNSEIYNGDSIEIIYNYNETINSIKKYFDEEENRVVTRDILIKVCTPVYMHIGMDVKLNSNVSQSPTIRTEIFDVISRHFTDKGLGEKIDESDIVHEIYSDESLSSYIDYIGVGFSTFHRTLNQSDVFAEGTSDGTTIDMQAVEYPVLKFLDITYIE